MTLEEQYKKETGQQTIAYQDNNGACHWTDHYVVWLKSALTRVTEERNELKEHIKSLLGFLDGHELPLGFNSLAGQANSAISRIEEGE